MWASDSVLTLLPQAASLLPSINLTASSSLPPCPATHPPTRALLQQASYFATCLLPLALEGADCCSSLWTQVGEKPPETFWEWQDKNTLTEQTMEGPRSSRWQQMQLATPPLKCCLLSWNLLEAGRFLPSFSWGFPAPLLLGALMLTVLGFSNSPGTPSFYAALK